MWKAIKPYVISIAIALGVGALSAYFTRDSMDIYSYIVKPPLSPPSIVFPIVWTILYILMGVSSAYVYVNRKRNPEAATNGLFAYAASLVVNFFWSLIFFNMQNFLFAFIWLILLWILIIVTIINYYKVSPVSAYLQIPYLLWVTFAGYLTLMIYLLNG